MRYLVIIEKGETSYGAYVPDLLGCAAVAGTEKEVLEIIHYAIEFHLDALREDGEQILQPRSNVGYIDVMAA